MPKLTIELNGDTLSILDKVYASMPRAAATLHTSAGQRALAIQALADQWDSMQDDSSPQEDAGAVEQRATIGKVVDEAILKSITDPNISVPIKLSHEQVTPRAVDGLVPWEYILTGYSKLDFVSVTANDETPVGNKRIEVIRAVLTRIPEDSWHTEQTRSVIAKAFERLR